MHLHDAPNDGILLTGQLEAEPRGSWLEELALPLHGSNLAYQQARSYFYEAPKQHS